MKILLVSVPLEFPLAVYCLAAQLSATPDVASAQIEILTLEASKLNKYENKTAESWRFLAKVDAMRPDLIAFSVYLWSHLCIRELIAITHRLYPEIHLIVGGPELETVDAASSFVGRGEVTAAIRGEGEVTMVELVRRLGNGDGPAGVAGCSWYNGSTVVHEPPRPSIDDLSILASPFLTGWVSEDLFARTGPIRKGQYPRAFVETYRGCYMQCSYCQWGNGTRRRFPFPQERVLAELSWIISRRLTNLFIVDAMFGYKKQMAKDILGHIIEEKRSHGADTTIVCYHNQDFFDPELLDLYREANVSVEVDLQSTDREVLDKAGRSKWYFESFDRHLNAFRERSVPTTGSADLMIGLPRDRLASFLESVDFMLQRGMTINLYQTSIIPNTSMLRDAEQDGTVFSNVPPRAVFKNRTFPVREMIAARLIGHGVDFFRLYPRTARLLWKRGFARPVDLCQKIGDLLWARHNIMYDESHRCDAIVPEEQQLIDRLLDDLCRDEWLRPLIHDIFRFEAATSRVRERGRMMTKDSIPLGNAVLACPDNWLASRPRFRREAVEEIQVQHHVGRAFDALNRFSEMPGEEYWRGLAQERERTIALIYLHRPDCTGYSLIDEELTYQLLLRLSGFFSVADCLENFVHNWRDQDLRSLQMMLTSLAVAGVIDWGSAAMSCK